jgi:uncharacterized protein involved in exopolysaccharide biosynthesis
MTPTVKEYFSALERLKQNNPERVEKGSQINKDTVALEAGRKRGSIRNRPGFSGLIEAIGQASSEQSLAASPKRAPHNPHQTAQVESLKRDLDIARSRYMSLLYLNLEMAKTIRKLGGEVPKISGVSEILIDPDSDDCPY